MSQHETYSAEKAAALAQGSAPELAPAQRLYSEHWQNEAAASILCGAAQILDTVKQEWGESWSEWDQAIRDGISGIQRKILEREAPPDLAGALAQGSAPSSAPAPTRELIEECGLALASEEIHCGFKHVATFDKLNKLRELLAGEREAQAPPDSPTREALLEAAEECYVAWCRYKDNRIFLCDSDAPGAFKVYRWAALPAAPSRTGEPK